MILSFFFVRIRATPRSTCNYTRFPFRTLFRSARLSGRSLALRDRAIANVRGLWSVAGSLFRLGVRTVATTARNGLNNVIGFFRDLPGRIGNALGNLGSLPYNAGRNVVQGLIDGIFAMIGRLASAAASIDRKSTRPNTSH